MILMKHLLVFSVLSAIVLSLFSFRQRSLLSGSLVFQTENYHDALWHVALMGAINQSVPPMHPLAQGEALQGYHYFNDLLWVIVHRLTGIPLLTLYLQVSPLVLAFLFSFSTAYLFEKVIGKKSLALWGASITLFGSSMAYLAPLFFPLSKRSQSVFWLDQPVHFIINQQLMLSLIMLNVIFLALFSKKKTLMMVLLSGLVLTIKVYAGMVILFALSVVAVLDLLVRRKFSWAKVALGAWCVAIPCLFLIGNRQGFPFLWEPGWFLKTLFESGDRLNWSQWELLRLDAMMHQSWHRLIILWGGAFVLFFVGNFGVKLLGVVFVKQIFQTEKKQRVFWMIQVVSVVFCALMPLLFLQKGVVWNTIQFLSYCFVPLGLLLTKGIDLCMKSMPKKMLLCGVLLLIALPTTLQTLWIDMQPASYTYLEPEFVRSVQQVSKLPDDMQILVGSQLYTTSLVPALSGRSVYYADEAVLRITGNAFEERKAFIDAIEIGEASCSARQVFVTLDAMQRVRAEPCLW